MKMANDLINQMIKYIEGAEKQMEDEYGVGAELKDIIAANHMPCLYYKLVKLANRGE